MSSEDIAPTILLIVILYFVFRCLSRPRQSASGEAGIRGVTRAMVDTVHGAFPDIPASNIIYSLSRTRSSQATSEEILERGFLPAPPASFSIPASLLPDQPTPVLASTTTQSNTKFTNQQKPNQTLIDRFNLSSRLPSRKGKEKDPAESPATAEAEKPVVGAKNEWADSKERREQELRERKERMILEARRRLLEKQAKETTTPTV
ncbi:hypothetical protein DB88DRAFT_113432 [Papiliotrema laurentii]|uniref:CUE domain-containing protein n=1 Tax=Papiliotrema laurentii TaxID=5418 RepID=A0AAD9CSX9_PAPLA|nr:hypothetical protein DB88DRAFT_113432 [Papiliotrema laurentii]